MLQLRVIEESHSAWSSQVVLVPKPDGSFRFCNDFRRLNEVSEFDAYPMPRVDELRTAQARSSPHHPLNNLTKGYWQVPLSKNAREKTAFATPGGLYQYTVLPFGVHGAPATFQRMMDHLLRPHQAYAAAYIDDIIIHSASWDIHLRHLRAVLGELRKAGLTATQPSADWAWRRPPTWATESDPGMSDPKRTSEDHPGLAPPHHQEANQIFPWTGRILPEVHSQFHHPGKPPP